MYISIDGAVKTTISIIQKRISEAQNTASRIRNTFSTRMSNPTPYLNFLAEISDANENFSVMPEQILDWMIKLITTKVRIIKLLVILSLCWSVMRIISIVKRINCSHARIIDKIFELVFNIFHLIQDMRYQTAANQWYASRVITTTVHGICNTVNKE